jgi:hypothetical protein
MNIARLFSVKGVNAKLSGRRGVQNIKADGMTEAITMKKLLAVILAAGLMATTVPQAATAGDHGWATAGKIMTGILGITILGNAIANSQPGPAYYAPAPRYYEPPPRERVWINGHYESRWEREWVPGHWDIRHGGRDLDDDEYGDDDTGGRSESRVWVNGHYRQREVRAWIPGHWEDRG